MPFLALLHRCRNILVRARKRGQAEGDTPEERGRNEKTSVKLARAGTYARARKRSRVVSALPRAWCTRAYESCAEVGASPGPRCPRWKRRETSKNNGAPTKFGRLWFILSLSLSLFVSDAHFRTCFCSGASMISATQSLNNTLNNKRSKYFFIHF